MGDICMSADPRLNLYAACGGFAGGCCVRTRRILVRKREVIVPVIGMEAQHVRAGEKHKRS